MPWQETAIQSLKTPGEVARGDVRACVCAGVYVGMRVRMRQRDSRLSPEINPEEKRSQYSCFPTLPMKQMPVPE